MKKAKTIAEATEFEELPNIGVEIAKDFRVLGLKKPIELKTKDPYKLYVSLCEKTKSYHDPCVLDTFMSAVSFARGNKAEPWWNFTEERKKNFAKIEKQVSKWK